MKSLPWDVLIHQPKADVVLLLAPSRSMGENSVEIREESISLLSGKQCFIYTHELRTDVVRQLAIDFNWHCSSKSIANRDKELSLNE